MRSQIAVRALAVVGSGILYGACFPPLGWYWLAWVALVPALLAIRGVSARAALGLGALLGVACTCATVDWLPRTVARYYEQPWAMGLGLFAGITALMVVPPYATAMLAYARLTPRAGIAGPILAAAAWTAMEFFRSNLWTGNPWVVLGYSQVDATALVQIADLTGVYGLSFLVAWVNVVIAESWGTQRDPGRATPVRRNAALVLGVVLGVVAYGRYRVAELERACATSHTVLVVQDNLDLGRRWTPGFEIENLTTYLSLTDQALREQTADLVLWPELAMTFFVERETRHRAAIARVLEPHGVELLGGGLHHDGSYDAPRYFNSGFILGPDGAVRARYDKQQLLPLMEYFPFPWLDPLRRRFSRARTLSPGERRGPLASALGPAGVVICNEILFPDEARAQVRAGASWLAVLTNDTWLADAKYSGIAFALARMRAVELHRPLVRASTWGPSAIVDAAGRVTAATPLDARTFLFGTVAPCGMLTAYARAGDVFAWTCVAAVLLSVVFVRCR